jgi:putative CocE/NonD family hydrolase
MSDERHAEDSTGLIEMRDGVRLATDVYLPHGEGPWTVLLERTPYDKRGTNHADRTLSDPLPKPKPAIARWFAERGFAYVLQDCRGRFGSEGSFEKYLSEQADGVDTLAWIRRQPWCDGRICTLGFSYGAHAQTALAAATPAGLAGMFIDSGGFSSAYDSGIRQGGAYELKQLTWALKHARMAPETQGDPERRRALEAVDIRDWIGKVWTRGHSAVSAAPEYESYILEQWAHERFDGFWRRPEFFARGYHDRFPDVPCMLMSSWYDPYALTAVENFMGLSRLKRSPVRLVLGPWTHGQRSVTHAGAVDFGPASTLDGNLAPDYSTLRCDFFDRHVRGGDAPDRLAAPVTVFVMGGGDGGRTAEGRLRHGGAWLRADAWPPADATPVRWHLAEDRRLQTTVPTAPGREDWVHDPQHPVPTVGGAITSGAPLMEGGAFDQRERAGVLDPHASGRSLTERPDVVCFRTGPLAADLTVVGPVRARLWVSTDAPDTDFTVKLVDEHPPSADWPDGFAMNITDGILRLRFRESFESPQLAVAGAVYPIEVTLPPTANLFARGHRLRVDIASSNFPHFDVNPNTGAPAGVPSEPVPARNSVHFGVDTPSHLELFVLPP